MTFSYFPRCLEVKERKNTIAFVHKLNFGTNMFCNYSFRELGGSYLTPQTKMWITTEEKYMFISHAILTNANEQTDHLQTNECHPWRFAPTVLMFGTLDPTKLIDIDIEFPNGPRIGKTKDNILISRGRTWPYCLCGICFTIKCFGKVDGSPPLVIQWKVVIPPA